MSGKQRATIEDVLAMSSATIPGTLAAEVIEMAPRRLIGYAREKPEIIQFPYQLSGNRMKVPRIPFLRWIGCTEEQIHNKKIR